jgi:hypothetical protein
MSGYKPTVDAVQGRLMAEALEIVRYLTNSSNATDLQQRQQRRLNELQAALTAFAHPICREACLVDTIPVKIRQAFVEAVALLKHYRELGGAVCKGTLSSATLSQYCSEDQPIALSEELAIMHLCQQFQLPAEFEQQVTNLLETVECKVTQQKQIIQAALTDVGLLPNPDNSPPRILYTDSVSIPVWRYPCSY